MAPVSGDGMPTASDFLFGNLLGQGSYAKVFHARMKNSRKEFAVKVMDKSFIRREKKEVFVMTERNVLKRLNHPHVVKFYCAFKDGQSLYLAMELAKGGDILNVIKDSYAENAAKGLDDKACDDVTTQFYVAELVQALEYIHSNGVIHRDVKPDNMLLTQEGHLKLCDFGSAKDQMDKERTTNQFCGTVMYLSPEVLRDEPVTRACDLWALACVIHEMHTGRTPFVAENDYLTFQEIMNHTNESLILPSTIPEQAQDLIRKLLVVNPDERLGASQDEEGYAALKEHPFFEGIEWEDLDKQTPPYTPPPLDLPEPRLDGASENWAVAEYFTDDAFSTSTYEDLMSSANGSGRRSRSSSMGSTTIKRPTCLAPDEVILFEGKVKIHARMFNRNRELVLTDQPRLVMLGSWTATYKKDIVLTKDTKTTIVNPHTFEITSFSGTYRITDTGNLAEQWVGAIEEEIANL